MRDNHTFRSLEGTVEDMIMAIVEELEAGYTSGSLFSKQRPGKDLHCDYKQTHTFILDAYKLLKEEMQNDEAK